MIEETMQRKNFTPQDVEAGQGFDQLYDADYFTSHKKKREIILVSDCCHADVVLNNMTGGRVYCEGCHKECNAISED